MTIERPFFLATRMTAGYDAAQVDVAVDLVLENLSLPRPRITSQTVSELAFGTVTFQRGYSIPEVDDWFDAAAAELHRRTTPGADAAHAPRRVPSVPEDIAVPTPVYEPTTSTAIVEVPNSTPWLLIGLAALIILIGALAYGLL